MANLEQALELCRKTADYPPGARFKWNAEVLWAVDSYLRQATPEKQQRLIDAVHAGQVGLRRPLRQRADRPVPAGGTAAADAMWPSDRRGAAACRSSRR